MERLEMLMLLVDEILDTTTKKHIVGGALMSVSLLFGGLAVTVMSLKLEEK
jgi:hypothetical protein